MRRLFPVVLGALIHLPALLGQVACDREPSCKLLHKRLKECDADRRSGLTEHDFVKLCEKRRDRPGTRAQIACSKESRCKPFNACLARGRELDRRALLDRRWEEVSQEASKGSYAKAFTFCDVRKDELKGAMKKRCEELPAQALGALTRELTTLRDGGSIPDKIPRCWELKRVAQRVGQKARQAADDLCLELEAARRLIATRAEVSKVLGGERPFLTYGCQLPRLEEVVRGVRSPFTEKVQAQLIEICLKTLGRAILAKRVPTQTACDVRDVYQAIRELGVKDPGLDPLMEQARKHCDK